MKKVIAFVAAVAALVFLASCQKTENYIENDGPCELTVGFGGYSTVETKVAGVVSDDNIIKDVQILVFRKEDSDVDSKVDAATRISGLNVTDTYTTTEKISCTRGNREVWVVVNSPVDYTSGNEAVLSLADLKAKTTVLSDNICTSDSRSFVMAGNKVIDLNAASQTVDVNIKRMACKVVIKGIENKFILPVYQKAGTLKITAAYLMSVAGYQKLDNLNTISTARTYYPSSAIGSAYWHGKNVKEPNALFTEDYLPVKVLEYNDKLENVSTFYAYPNDAAAEKNETWSIRGTMLVIETTIYGGTYYYPVQLPSLESNKCYEVSLIIKHPGSEKPWKPLEFDDVTTKITITSWTSVSLNSEI